MAIKQTLLRSPFVWLALLGASLVISLNVVASPSASAATLTTWQTFIELKCSGGTADAAERCAGELTTQLQTSCGDEKEDDTYSACWRKFITDNGGTAEADSSPFEKEIPINEGSGCGGTETIIIKCGNNDNGVWSLLLLVINILTAGIGIAAVGGIIYGSVLYTSAGDNDGQIKQAKEVIRNVIIGVILYIAMYAILQFIIPGGVFDRSFTPPPPVATTGSPGGGSGSSTGGGSSDTTPNGKFKPSQVLIIGDSITAMAARGESQGNEGWWQYFLKDKTGTFKFSAQNGSGYLTKGDFSNGTTFLDRIDDISSKKPKAIVIAGGINDDGNANAAKGIEKYYKRLATTLTANNINPKNVYVFVPRLKGRANNIVPLVKSNAAKIGANYIEVGSYTATFDGLHPTSESANKIATGLAGSSNFDEKLISEDGSSSSGGGSSSNVTVDSIPLNNLRDASSATGVLKAGVLYRSAQLSNLTAPNSKKMSTLLGSTATIIDLRTDSQRSAAPDKAIDGSKTSTVPIEGVLDTAPMVTDPARRTQLAKALKIAANARGPVLIHCVAGKDRTGWMVAMIMYSVGANDQQVMKEYLKSNVDIPGGVKKEWLNSGLQQARSQYGTIKAYLKATGLTDSDLSKINSKFGA